MSKTKRVFAALMAAFVIVTTTYNVFTVDVYATTDVVLGGELGSLLISFILGMESSYTSRSYSGDTVDRMYEFEEFLATPEGQSLLNQVQVKTHDGKMVDIESLRGSESLEDLSDIFDSNVSGLVSTPDLYNLASGFFAYVTDPANGSELGAAINAAADQEVTYGPFPSNWYFSSVDDPVYSLNSVDLFSSSYPEFSLEGNSFVEIYNPYMSDCFVILPCYENYFIFFGSYNSGSFINFNRDADNRIASYIFARYLQTGVLDMLYQPDSSVFYNDNTSEVYMCGCIRFVYDNDTYILNPDGSIVSVLDGQPDQVVIPHVITPEGYLTSVKPIVKMDISSLVDAIGQAIADAYPDEAPVLTQEAIDYITNNVSNVYDDAVTNYYNDTSYIDQSQYITNVTNVFEQAIADNPVIDIPVTDAGILSGIKAIPGQIANVLKDIFVPDIALYSFYFLDIKSKFAFADNFLNFGSNLITILFDSDPEIPKIVIDFGLAESKYNYGGRTYALDMTFYDRFKPLVDNIIVSFSWLAFGYWIYKNLPEIISGAILSRKDYAVVKETANTVFSKGGTFGSFSKERVKEIRDIDKIK